MKYTIITRCSSYQSYEIEAESFEAAKDKFDPSTEEHDPDDVYFTNGEEEVWLIEDEDGNQMVY